MPPSTNGEREAGMVFLVGAGPGDPGLLTVRGRALLDDCDAIVYDALANPAMLVRGETGVRSAPELYYVGKRGGEPSMDQDDIARLLVELARAGKRVVRLKGGDPFVFGRGGEEAQALVEAEIAFEVVPGITAGIAAPAYAGIPVTHRGLATSVTFVTGHENPAKAHIQTDWRAIAKTGGTIVLYMGVRTLPAIASALMEAGMPGEIPAAAIQWGTLPRQRTVVATLATLAEEAEREHVTAPVITVIGWSVVMRDEIAWFDRRPLFGKRIVVTRAASQATALSGRLRELGAEVLEMPAMRIARLDQTELHAAIARLSTYQWIMFTSQNAVPIFWEALRAAGRDMRALGGARIAAVGPATTTALHERGIVVDVLPERFVAEGLLDALSARGDIAGARVLYVTAEGAREVLPAGLTRLGASVDVVAIYRSTLDGKGAGKLRERIEHGEVELVTFTSASSVQGYVEAVGAELAQRAPAASIGPVTSEAARSAGIEVVVEASEATIPGLVEAITRTWGGGGRPTT